MNEEGLFGTMFLTLSPFLMILADLKGNIPLMLFTIIWTIWWAMFCIDDWFLHSELIIWLLVEEDADIISNTDTEEN